MELLSNDAYYSVAATVSWCSIRSGVSSGRDSLNIEECRLHQLRHQSLLGMTSLIEPSLKEGDSVWGVKCVLEASSKLKLAILLLNHSLQPTQWGGEANFQLCPFQYRLWSQKSIPWLCIHGQHIPSWVLLNETLKCFLLAKTSLTELFCGQFQCCSKVCL